jgi:hypothetical protein
MNIQSKLDVIAKSVPHLTSLNLCENNWMYSVPGGQEHHRLLNLNLTKMNALEELTLCTEQLVGFEQLPRLRSMNVTLSSYCTFPMNWGSSLRLTELSFSCSNKADWIFIELLKACSSLLKRLTLSSDEDDPCSNLLFIIPCVKYAPSHLTHLCIEAGKSNPLKLIVEELPVLTQLKSIVINSSSKSHDTRTLLLSLQTKFVHLESCVINSATILLCAKSQKSTTSS